MLFNREEIELSLQEKVNEKIEILRHELAQSMLGGRLSEELFFVFDKKEKDIAGGPFSSKAEAQSYIDDMDDSDNLVVMTEKALKKKLLPNTK